MVSAWRRYCFGERLVVRVDSLDLRGSTRMDTKRSPRRAPARQANGVSRTYKLFGLSHPCRRTRIHAKIHDSLCGFGHRGLRNNGLLCRRVLEVAGTAGTKMEFRPTKHRWSSFRFGSVQREARE
jgi:hypothetical protein